MYKVTINLHKKYCKVNKHDGMDLRNVDPIGELPKLCVKIRPDS